MCTAITYQTNDHYFGRNLDYEFHYHEEVTITPRKFPLSFRLEKPLSSHYAMIGMAMVADNYPLYYEATNEAGLSMAGLNFPGNAVYRDVREGMVNITPFEFIPWILGQCSCIAEVKQCLQNLNLVNIQFSQKLPLSPLHWMISDKQHSIAVEPMEDGIKVFDDLVGVLTNNPPFPYHVHNLENYLNLTREEPVNRLAPHMDIIPYSRGMGAFGLPGDLSSSSRFVKAAFTKLNSISQKDEASSVSQFFHILTSVAQQEGCVRVGNGFEKTIYSSCCNADKGIYYYTTYENRQITAVHMHHCDLESRRLFRYPMRSEQQLFHEN